MIRGELTYSLPDPPGGFHHNSSKLVNNHGAGKVIVIDILQQADVKRKQIKIKREKK
tara:strand:- start:2031 stop:2201 length:171 start_codon:yes stop_codon:yes gene_type:complete